MYISEIKIDGYKNCNIKSTISFNPRLNILVERMLLEKQQLSMQYE